MPKTETTVQYEIINQIGVLSDEGDWRVELNRISWDGKEPKYDLRKWRSDHEKMGKGLTLTNSEVLRLYEILKNEQPYLAAEENPM